MLPAPRARGRAAQLRRFADAGRDAGFPHGGSLWIRLRFGFARISGVNENHPVLQAFEARLRALQAEYQRLPDERSRYRRAQIEQLISQWAPGRLGAI